MSFQSQMAEDLGLLLNASEFDEAGTYTGRTAASGFAVRVVRGDIQTGAAPIDQGTEHSRNCQAMLIRSVIQAGLLSTESVARDPLRGDKLTLTDGVWYVAAVGAIDVGGGVSVSLQRDDFGAPAGTGAHEVR